jgi:hypothetical protein
LLLDPHQQLWLRLVDREPRDLTNFADVSDCHVHPRPAGISMESIMAFAKSESRQLLSSNIRRCSS